ncbi:aminoglycoside adenylyltransferase domain-containing protein [Pelagerythrobacter marinus]|uniref:aminoglycoside adenylyltransferase domain-containing protein n=1 Tax=Pelagerythrobacter marinus TaxID=538382 RepID=UPI002036D322|nr:aminoglycoside adenylyltransferase domain-containing protein [Pelagerythrobacter marinus]USA39937.1 DUF4111 domain-containing protein [Pelagerythrobacter marinus]WPZ05944.1 DUF4111 domain-containing protein [Pelagerythrobacter marinus]
MNTGTGEPAIPLEATEALATLQRRMGPALTAVYLHGSAVGEGLREHSDVDLLAIVDRPPSPAARVALAEELMAISGHYPDDPRGRRPLEVAIVQRRDLERPPYPAQCVFLYGEWLRPAIERGEVPQAGPDPEITLLLAQARHEALPLLGPDIANLVPDVPSDDIRRAIGDLLPTLLDTIERDERNVLLTLARMWLTLATGRFVSKNVAADWAVPRLSARGARALSRARDIYLGQEGEVETGNPRLREAEIHRAAAEMSARIRAFRPSSS